MAAPLRAVRPAGTWAGSWVHTDSAPVGPRITSLPPPGLDNAALTVHLFPTWTHRFLAAQTSTLLTAYAFGTIPQGAGALWGGWTPL